MSVRRCYQASIAILLMVTSPLFARTFTNSKGETIKATLISANERTVTLRLDKNRKIFTIDKSTLSRADQIYIDALQKEEDAKADAEREAVDAKQRTEEAIAKIVEFTKANKGKKVGDGECFTLANEAFKAAGIARKDRPGNREWGRLVDWKKEQVQPGDILELRSAVFPGTTTGPFHTAVIMSKGRRGNFDTMEQNVGNKKIVVARSYSLGDLKRGEVFVYRFEYQ
ncbi:MAG: hypothetical protein ACSHX6_09275 [Akkermansiaceae bacterium]